MLGYHQPGQDSCLSGCGHRVDSVGNHEYAGAVIGRLIDEYAGAVIADRAGIKAYSLPTLSTLWPQPLQTTNPAQARA